LEENLLNLPTLKIGKLIAKIPIIQGGMAVKISTAPLAAAVANEGGIGIIGASGMESNELKNEIERARELSSGIIGVNIMVAVSNFKKLVNTAISKNIDLIIAGAGFSRDIFSLGKENNIEIVPIVSSLKLAKISEKLGASAIVVEGKEAGGHLGTDKSMKTLIKKISRVINIPVIAAGGIINGKDIVEALKLGADGVQMGSRFVASEECDISEIFKKKYINAQKDDFLIIKSPVGLPGQAIKNEFTELLEQGKVKTGQLCKYQCLKKCSRSFCIMKSLEAARIGNMKEGLVFAGQEAYRINKILSVKDIFTKLINEALDFLQEGAKK